MSNVLTGSVQYGPNLHAIDWAYGDFVAYGCQNMVVVVQATSLESIACLEGHDRSVSKIRWSPDRFPVDETSAKNDNLRRLRLASSDISGLIVVWDVLYSKTISCFGGVTEDTCKFVAEMQWLEWRDARPTDLLLALHAAWNSSQFSSLILWNAVEGTKIWTKPWQHNELSLYTFALNPFQLNNMAFVTCDGHLLLLDDLSVTKAPTFSARNMRQFNVNQSDSQTSRKNYSGNSGSLASAIVKTPLIKALTATVSIATDKSSRMLDNLNDNLGVSDPFITAGSLSEHGQTLVGQQHGDFSHSYCTSAPFDECFIQLIYHPAVRHHLLLVYRRLVLLLDLQNDAYVGSQVVFDKTASPIFCVIPSSVRDTLYFVQENGAISQRIQKYKPLNDFCGSIADLENSANCMSRKDQEMEIVYDLVTVSDSVKVTRHCKVVGSTLCPITQRRLCLLLSSGKLLFYDLLTTPTHSTKDQPTIESPFYNTLTQLVNLDSDCNHVKSAKLRLTNRAVLGSLGNGLTVVKLCPEPSGPGRQLAAIGTTDGCVQIVEIYTTQVERDFNVHSCAVKCLEWVGPHRLITSATSQPSGGLSSASLAAYRNELYLTDVRTGFSKSIRRMDDFLDDSPIYLLRVSHFRCFLAIAFRDQQPLEIWDLKTFRRLCFPAADAVSDSSVILTLHADGALSLWRTTDLFCYRQWGGTTSLTSPVQCINSRKIIDADLMTANGSVVVMLTADGCLRVENVNSVMMTASLRSSTAVFERLLDIGSMALPKKIITLIKIVMLDRSIGQCYASGAELDEKWSICSLIKRLDIDDDDKSLINAFLTHALPDRTNFHPEQASHAAFLCRLLNDEWEANFWNLIDTAYPQPGRLLFPADPAHFDLYVNNRTFKTRQLARSRAFDRSRCSLSLQKRHVNNLILLGAYDRAARVLLEGCGEGMSPDSGHDGASHYYADCLKACLLSAAACDTGQTALTGNSVLKMASTNLIADGRLDDGVELLRLSGQPADACRYLQSFNRWDAAHWLAKVAFVDSSDRSLFVDIGRRFLDALANPPASKKAAALFLALSIEPHNLNRIVDLLLRCNQTRLAVLFTQFCCDRLNSKSISLDNITQESGNSSNLTQTGCEKADKNKFNSLQQESGKSGNDTAHRTEETSENFNSRNTTDVNRTSDNGLHNNPVHALNYRAIDGGYLNDAFMEGLNLEYARMLSSIGLRAAARFNASKCSGDVRITLLREFEVLSNESAN